MRKGEELYYLFSDHLGSSNVSYRADGQQTIIQRYYPWGTIRPGPDNALPTDYTFTGQKLDESTGLMYYGARYYDAALGRFVQADTIVPNPANPQDLNRYAYVRNNPLRYVDPTGYFTVDELVNWGVTHNQIREWQQEHPAWWAIIEEARLFDEVRALRKFRGLGPKKWRGEFSICEGSLRLVDWKAWEAYGLEYFRYHTKEHELWRHTPGQTKWDLGGWEHVPTPTEFLRPYEPPQPPQGIDWGEVDGLTVLLDVTAVGLAGAGVVAEASPQGQGIGYWLADASLMVDLMSLARTEQQLREGKASQEDAMFELDTTRMGMTNPDPMTQLGVALAQLVHDLLPSH